MKTKGVILAGILRHITAFVDVRQVIKLEHVIPRDSMAGLVAIVALDVGKAVFGDAKKDAAVVMVQKKEIPESGALPAQVQIHVVPGAAVQNEESEDCLFLLPKVLG